MFNPQIVLMLLEQNNIPHKDLLDYLGKNHNGSLKQILRGDVKASNLEKFSEFFGVPVDTFFEREPSNPGVVVGGRGNRVHHFSVNSNVAAIEKLEALVKEKETLIEEKEKRIKVLEEFNESLKKLLAAK